MKHALLRPLALVAALSLGTIGSVQAAEYTTLDAEASSLTFGYSQMNVKMDGSFTDIKATELSFDPANPEVAKVSIEIALSSIDAGYAEANEELAKDEWLALAQYPVATFTANQVEALGDGQYQVSGDLSIKGHTQAVTAPFSIKEEADSATFTGSFIFQRGDFSIGEGAWKSFGIVANDIEINFELVAKE